MKTVSTMEQVRKLRIGEVARFRIPVRSVVADDWRCPRCQYAFMSEHPPAFCAGCGSRWKRPPARG